MLAIPFYKTLSLWFLWHCFLLIFFLCLASLQEVPVFADPLNVGEALLNSHPWAIWISFMVGLLSLCWRCPLCPKPLRLPWAPVWVASWGHRSLSPSAWVISGSLTRTISQIANLLLSVSISGVTPGSQRALGFIFDASFPIPLPPQPYPSASTDCPLGLLDGSHLPPSCRHGPTLATSCPLPPCLCLPSSLASGFPSLPVTHPHLAVRGIFVKHKSNHALLLQYVPCFSSVLRIRSYLLVLKAWGDLGPDHHHLSLSLWLPKL